jgi:hypothetical protein
MTAKQKRKITRRSKRRVPIAADSVKLSSSERELLAIPKSEWEIAKRQERIVKTAIRTSVEKAAERPVNAHGSSSYGTLSSKPHSFGVSASQTWASSGKSATQSGARGHPRRSGR